ncbi:MAG: sugar phosphate isomerase/epimerase [Chloroflexi bacterium]|nr:sugar phosphate isomerase/epimerase [Chloroflexota bacterium]
MRLQVGCFPDRLGMEEQIAIGGALGFDSISLDGLHGGLDRYLETHEVAELKDLLQKNGLGIANVWAGPLYEHEGELWDKKIAEARRRYEVIAELGCKQVAINTPLCWPKIPSEYEWDWLAKKYNAYMDILDGYGLELVLEFIGSHLIGPLRGSSAVYPWICNTDSALELVKRIDRKGVGLIIDVMHWWAPGGTYEDLHKVKGLPLAVHFFDIRNGATRETANDGTDRVLPGEGQIDLVKFLRNLKEDGFDGDVWPEIFGLKELREGDSWEVPKKVRDACRSVMDQV